MKKIALVLLLLYVVLVAFTARAEFITVSGTLANTGGIPVAVNMTDGDTIDITVLTDSLGFYSIVATTNDSAGSVYVSFYDCNNVAHDTMINFYTGMPEIIFNGDYCPGAGTDTCYAHFNTTYDQPANTFNLEIDSITQQNAITYLWTFGDGTYSDLPFPTHEYAVNGLYEICVNITEADSETCQYCNTIGFDTTGVGFTVNVVAFGSLYTRSFTNISQVDIYPNPTNGFVTLRFASSQPEKFDVTVHNTSGKEMLKHNFAATIGKNEIPLSLEELSDGIYVVVLSNSEKEVISRVVIKK